MQPANPIEAVTHSDPYPYYRRLAERALHYDAGLGLWIAGAPATVRAVLEHGAARVRPAAQPVPPALAGETAGLMFGRFVRMRDDAGRTVVKALLSQYLRALPDVLSPCWPDMPATSAALDDFLFDAPVYALAQRLGIAAADLPAYGAAVRRFRRALGAAADAAQVAEGSAGADWLQSAMLRHLQNPARGTPLRRLLDDASSALVEPAIIAANLVGLLFQSCEAGAGLIGNTLVALARNPGQAVAARRNMQYCKQIVARTAQDDPPIHNTRRYVADDISVDGHVVPAGATILVVLAAAGTLAPQGAVPWTFGAGRHACPGHDPAVSCAAGAAGHLLDAGLKPADLLPGLAYWNLPNARVPRFAGNAGFAGGAGHSGAS